MAINKVEYGGKTIIDLTNDTVTSTNLLEGATAHNAAGEVITGIAKGMDEFEKSEIDTSAYSRAIPDYWDKPVTDAINTINALGTDYVPVASMFTDMHHNTGKARYTGALAAKVMDRCGVPFAMNLGDIFSQQGHTYTSESQVVDNYIDTNRIAAPIGWYRYLPTQGNHDGSWGTLDGNTYAYQTPQAKLNKWVYDKLIPHSNHVFGGDGSFYYADDTAHKIRVIMLNSLWSGSTVDYPNFKEYSRQHYWGYGQAQLDWLSSTALNVGEGWVIVIGTHIPPVTLTRDDGTSHNYTTNTRDAHILIGILNAYQNRTSYTGSYTKNAGRGEGDWANVLVGANYTNAKGRIAAFCSGHCHIDRIDDKSLSFPVVTVTADACISYDNADKPLRVAGTNTEHVIDFLCVNRADEIVSLVRLGFGQYISGRAVRSFSYGAKEVYSITNTLTGASNSNGAVSITEGDAYTATISLFDNYENLTVKVTMGGTDVTSSVYSNGSISIAEVTGDIVITATATKKAAYTNLADPSSADWLNGYRFSSSGNTTAFTGSVVTNWIECKRGDVLRFRGLLLTSKQQSSNTTAPYMRLEFVDGGVANNAVDLNTYEGAFTIESNGDLAYTVLCSSGTTQMLISNGEVKKIRFSGLLASGYTANDVIITKNEPIE